MTVITRQRSKRRMVSSVRIMKAWCFMMQRLLVKLLARHKIVYDERVVEVMTTEVLQALCRAEDRLKSLDPRPVPPIIGAYRMGDTEMQSICLHCVEQLHGSLTSTLIREGHSSNGVTFCWVPFACAACGREVQGCH